MTGSSPNGHSRLAASRPARLGVLVSYLRPEEKSILAAARDRGIEVAPIFDRDLVLDLSSPHAPGSGLDFDVVLDRCVAHSRSGYTLRALRRWGIPTLNDAEAVRLCDDKAENSLVLEAAGIPTPRTLIAFDVGSAIQACETLGYPAVLKPVTGSWGRLLARVNGPDQARTVLEQKKELGSFHHAIFYVQEYVEKPALSKVDAKPYMAMRKWATQFYEIPAEV